MDIKNIRVLLLDGDGVLYHGDRPVPALNRFFEMLNQRGIRWGLLTNNATKSVGEYVAKLANFNVSADEDSIFTSATVTANYLQETYPPDTGIYVIGEMGLQSTLAKVGMQVYTGDEHPEGISAVVVGLDRGLTYEKLRVATHLIRYEGAAFIATNPDKTYPSPNGLTPGAGTLVAALVASTDVQPTVIGKPAPTIYRLAMQHLDGTVGNTAMIGDRLDTDIAGASLLGIGTILVLSGVSTRAEAEASAIRPDLVLDDIGMLADALQKVIA